MTYVTRARKTLTRLQDAVTKARRRYHFLKANGHDNPAHDHVIVRCENWINQNIGAHDSEGARMIANGDLVPSGNGHLYIHLA